MRILAGERVQSALTQGIVLKRMGEDPYQLSEDYAAVTLAELNMKSGDGFVLTGGMD